MIKFGDYVKLKENLEVGKRYGCITLQPCMAFEGTRKCLGQHISGNYLIPIGDGRIFKFSPAMLEKVRDKELNNEKE